MSAAADRQSGHKRSGSATARIGVFQPAMRVWRRGVRVISDPEIDRAVPSSHGLLHDAAGVPSRFEDCAQQGSETESGLLNLDTGALTRPLGIAGGDLR